MKKFFLSILVIVFTFLQPLFSQELPQITPPSPTAYEIAKYGDVTVNESSGTISPNIPLYNYQAGKLQLPMSLSYQGNAVKVDQSSGWTGINWVLNAGGVITRTVKDQDDFTPRTPNSFFTYEELSDMSFNDINSSEDDELIFNLVNGASVDSEVDMFNFSFPGYSGSFFLKPEEEIINGNTIITLVPYLTKYDKELKIEIGDPTYFSGIIGIQPEFREITITTPDGIKYIFGGEHASEQTMIYQEGTRLGELGIAPVQTGYYLHTIIHPYGDEMYFEYDNDDDYSLYLARSQSRSLLVSSSSDCPQVMFDPTNQDPPIMTRQDIKNACFLKEISSNTSDIVVKFDSNTYTNPIETTNYKKELHTIRIKDSVQNTLLKRISLDYEFPISVGESIASRFFLKEVAYAGSNNVEEYKYTMEYNDLASLPKRFSADQDHIGNYNNKGNNDDVILPQTDNPYFANVNSSFADKSADFEYASKGVLTKITYPTGGYTEFDYECGKTIAEVTPDSRKDLRIYFQDDTRNGATLVEDDLTIGFPSLSEDGTISGFPPNQTINASINIEIIDHLVRGNFVDVTLYEGGQNGSFIEDKRINLENPNSIKVINETFSFDFVSGQSYRLKLSFENRNSNSSGLTNTMLSNQVRAHLRFDYIPGESTVLIDDVGVRIKRTKDWSKDLTNSAKPPIIKRYYYRKVKHLNTSAHYDSGTTLFPPQYLNNSMIRRCCPSTGFGGITIGESIYIMINLQSNSLTNIFSNSSNSKMYSDVTISYGGDNFENGGVEKTFSVTEDPTPFPFLGFASEFVEIIPTARENKSVRNGTLLKESIFKKETDKYFILKETSNEYNVAHDYVNFVSNNLCKVMYDRPCSGPIFPTENLYVGLYHTYSHKVLLEETTTKEFIEDVLLLSPDPPNPSSYIETTQHYKYDSPYVSLPSSTKAFTNSNTEWIQKDIYYADDVENISSLNGGDISNIELSAINMLKQGDLHQFNTPIQIETYKKAGDEGIVSQETLLSTQRTLFKHSNYLSLPKSIQTSKGGNTLENRITYHSYDNKGNPTEISKTAGTHIVYIWGYNQTKPIAKIENHYNTGDSVSGLQAKIDAAVLSSNADDDRTHGTIGKEGDLRADLNAIRNLLPKAMVTTYTYDPLIGVTSITDPRGRTIYYTYDEFNRLEHVTDNEGKVLSKNEYNYKN